MAGSAISTFQDAGCFLASLKEVGYRSLLVSEPGEFSASVTSILLDKMRLSWVSEQPGRIAFRGLPPATTRAVLCVHEGTLSCGGLTIGEGQLFTHGAGHDVHEWTAGAVEWRDILISTRHLTAFARALAGAPMEIPTDVRLWRPPAALLRRLCSLHAAATHLTEKRPRTTYTVQAAHGLEQELIELLVQCLSEATVEAPGTSVTRSADVVSAFEVGLSAHERPIELPKICQQLGIPERTLRACCQRQLGMTPERYLNLRRMQIDGRDPSDGG